MEARIYTTTSKREENQDCAVIIKNRNEIVVAKDEFEKAMFDSATSKVLAVVLDGLGGHLHGRLASHMVADLICEEFPQSVELTTLLFDINECMQKCSDCGLTTIAAIHSSEEKGVFALNCGDTRVYGFEKGEFCQITKDDSTIPLLVKAFGLTEYEASKHEKAALTNCLGHRFFRLKEIKLNLAFDLFLIMSDGAYLSLVEDDWEKLRLLAQKGREMDMDAMLEVIKVAIKNRGEDNATVVILKI